MRLPWVTVRAGAPRLIRPLRRRGEVLDALREAAVTRELDAVDSCDPDLVLVDLELDADSRFVRRTDEAAEPGTAPTPDRSLPTEASDS